MDGLDDLVEFALQPFIVADVEIAGEQGVKRLVEVLLGGFQMVRLVVGLSGCVLLFRLRNQRLGRIGLQIHIWLRLRLRIGLLGDRSSDVGGLGLSGKGSGGRFGVIGLASGAKHHACEQGHRNHTAKDFHHFETALSHSTLGQ